MRIGIDIGGTHTDGVLIDGARLVAATKVPTCHDNLLESINRVLHSILAGQDPARVSTLNLSTTLTTNAIITGKIDPVGVLVTGGPGVAPEAYAIGDHFHTIPGSLDHLGTETKKLDDETLDGAIAECVAQGVRSFAVVSKFSPRNPVHENQIQERLHEVSDFISCGSLLSGQLNFGRRIHTAYFNSAVWRTFRTFSSALTTSLAGFDLRADINILKADGGTMPLSRAIEHPVQSIFSGPAASVMGILATTPIEEDVLMLDIGGTTTDIALFASGQPLLEREGIAIEGRPTLVRAIHVESIGIGGDSQIRIEKKLVQVGPQRVGPCMAAGGETPSLMDAFNVLGLAAFGDNSLSRQGMERLAHAESTTAEQLAADAIDVAINAISSKIDALVALVNSKPVYTIHEILEEREITPLKIIIIGGPASAFKKLMEQRLNMEVIVPPLHGVTNAIGAALTRTTTHLTLMADTSRGKLSVPMLSIYRQVPRGYTLETAVAEAKSLLAEDMAQDGVPISAEEVQITQADSFNMVEGSYTAGKNIRVVAQVQPKVIARLDPATIAPFPIA